MREELVEFGKTDSLANRKKAKPTVLIIAALGDGGINDIGLFPYCVVVSFGRNGNRNFTTLVSI